MEARLPHALAALLTSSGLTWLAFPPGELVWAGTFGVAPLIYVAARSRPARAGLLAGVYAFSLALLLSSWLPGVLEESFRATRVGAFGLWLALGSLAVPLAVAFGIAIRWVGAQSVLFVPSVALGWALVELGYSRIFPGLPWLTVGAPLIETPLAPLAAAFGVHAVSGLAFGMNAALAQLWLGGAWRQAARGLALVWLLAAPGLWGGLTEAGAEGRPLRVTIVQPGLPMSQRSQPSFAVDNIERLIELSRTAARADLIVWPESAFVSSVDGRPGLRARVKTFVEESGVPVLAGAHRASNGAQRTSAHFFEPGRAPRPVHDKARMIPLAETVPSWVGPAIRRALGRLVPSIPGESAEREPAQLGPAGASILLCHEAAFSGATAAPESPLILNLVNDGWYDRTAGAAQQLQLSRWRAVESGAPLVRVAATGTSALVLPSGAMAERIGLGRSGTLTLDLDLRAAITPFERWGYAPVVAAALLLAVLAAWSRCARRILPRGTRRGSIRRGGNAPRFRILDRVPGD